MAEEGRYGYEHDSEVVRGGGVMMSEYLLEDAEQMPEMAFVVSSTRTSQPTGDDGLRCTVSHICDIVTLTHSAKGPRVLLTRFTVNYYGQ